jgi:hypothetical protein
MIVQLVVAGWCWRSCSSLVNLGLINEALAPDCKNGNTLWVDAIAKEMKEVCIDFNILPDGHSAPIGYQKIPCHMIFDVKM